MAFWGSPTISRITTENKVRRPDRAVPRPPAYLIQSLLHSPAESIHRHLPCRAAAIVSRQAIHQRFGHANSPKQNGKKIA